MWPIDVLLELRLVFVTVAIAVSSVCSTQQLWAQPESSLYVDPKHLLQHLFHF